MCALDDSSNETVFDKKFSSGNVLNDTEANEQLRASALDRD